MNEPKIAIVAALQAEIAPLARAWQRRRIEHAGRSFTLFSQGNAVAVAGGIGARAAARAAEAVVVHCRPQLLVSAGFAGGLEARMTAGTLLFPSRVVDAETGQAFVTAVKQSATGQSVVLASSLKVLQREGKELLAHLTGAVAVDMEAAAVARVAGAHGLPFIAAKVVSDALDFPMPPAGDFITADGEFRRGAFAAWLALRPRWWMPALALANNSRQAASVLRRKLRELLSVPDPGLLEVQIEFKL